MEPVDLDTASLEFEQKKNEDMLRENEKERHLCQEEQKKCAEGGHGSSKSYDRVQLEYHHSVNRKGVARGIT